VDDVTDHRVSNALDIQPHLLHKLNEFRGIHRTEILRTRSSPAAELRC
jgi:hypothetical protein